MSRRRIPTTSRPTPTFQAPSSPLNNEFNEPIIKHIPFLKSNLIQGENEIFCEFLIFVLTVIAASTQLIHLYRSVWWLPDTFVNSSMVICAAI
jgi:hypothetical protein